MSCFLLTGPVGRVRVGLSLPFSIKKMKFFDTVVLVTGANRGYGEAIAREFLSRLDEESMLLLHSRTGAVPWLQKELIISSKCKIEFLIGDLSENINWNELLESKAGHSSFKNAFLISNAGTCGNIEKPLLESGHTLGKILHMYFGLIKLLFQEKCPVFGQ